MNTTTQQFRGPANRLSALFSRQETYTVPMKFGVCKKLFLLAPLLFSAVASAQESRLALIIGNSEYKDSPLVNPINDARDMAIVLEDLGFEVMLHTNADRLGMGQAIRDFGKKLKHDRGVGLFYYAGHGMQIENRNYLIPVGTPMAEEDEVPYESVDVGSVLAKMESAGNALNLIILDACRNNPFPQRFRSTSRGLARVQAPIGSLVVYATAPGAVAADGNGRNGVFTSALLEQLRTDGLSLTQTIRRTRAAVVQATNGKQVPWESSSLLEDYYFSIPAQPLPTAERTDQASRPATLPGVDSVADATAIVESQPERLTRTEESPNEPESRSETLTMLDNVQPDKPAPVKQPERATDAIIETEPVRVEMGQSSPRGISTLTVQVDPPDARVRIMDIVEKYQPGMELNNSRTYDLYITREGYDAYRQYISLDDQATQIAISLRKQSVTEPQMSAIAGGSFSMGCTRGDSDCESYEKPSHAVNTGPYYISLTEVTVGLFEEFVSMSGYVTDAEKNAGGNDGCFVWTDSGGISRSAARWEWDSKKNWRNPGFQQTAEHPVTCVSWNDANSYVVWLARQTGRAYALPSESQWELAARAGTQSPFGEASSERGLCALANLADRSQSPTGSKWNDRISCNDYHWFSAPVASYQANGFGLFDMQGNVWEWVADTWADNFDSTAVDGTANTKGAHDARVLRGGGWDTDGKRARLSSRSKGPATGRASMTGFRVVLTNPTR